LDFILIWKHLKPPISNKRLGAYNLNFKSD